MLKATLLLGAAIQDGFIGSLQDPITKYIPELDNSAYEGVTVEHLATMTSGVTWNEDYTDPNSDVAMMARFVLEYGDDAIVEQMKQLPREANPGTKWVYKTGETNLLGMLVENAIGLPLAAYAKPKLLIQQVLRRIIWMILVEVLGLLHISRLADYE